VAFDGGEVYRAVRCRMTFLPTFHATKLYGPVPTGTYLLAGLASSAALWIPRYGDASACRNELSGADNRIEIVCSLTTVAPA